MDTGPSSRSTGHNRKETITKNMGKVLQLTLEGRGNMGERLRYFHLTGPGGFPEEVGTPNDNK